MSVYCETEDESKKDRLPKEERIQIPGIETKPSGSLRTDEQIQHEGPATRSRQNTRTMNDNGMSMSQPKSLAHAVGGGGRRVAPGNAFDGSNG